MQGAKQSLLEKNGINDLKEIQVPLSALSEDCSLEMNKGYDKQ